jgi:predicted  nucleic acid-binding Zn-ribbon protein
MVNVVNIQHHPFFMSSVVSTADLPHAGNPGQNRAESIDDLFYGHQAVSREREALQHQVEKLKGEIQRMRQHIEQEPQRIATAVEAAKVHVQNTIEQSGQR